MRPFRCPLGFDRDRDTIAAHRRTCQEVRMEVITVIPSICSQSDLDGFNTLLRTNRLRTALRSGHLAQFIDERIIHHRRVETRSNAVRLTARDVIHYYFRR